MGINELEKIAAQLMEDRFRKKEKKLVKAKAEIETIERECEAYCDGVSDAIGRVWLVLHEDGEETREGVQVNIGDEP